METELLSIWDSLYKSWVTKVSNPVQPLTYISDCRTRLSLRMFMAKGIEQMWAALEVVAMEDWIYFLVLGWRV